MITYEKTLKVSVKGQITLPKAVRQALGTEFVHVVIEDGVVRIESVPDVAGSLSRYAQPYAAYEEARDKAWSEVVNDRASRD